MGLFLPQFIFLILHLLVTSSYMFYIVYFRWCSSRRKQNGFLAFWGRILYHLIVTRYLSWQTYIKTMYVWWRYFYNKFKTLISIRLTRILKSNLSEFFTITMWMWMLWNQIFVKQIPFCQYLISFMRHLSISFYLCIFFLFFRKIRKNSATHLGAGGLCPTKRTVCILQRKSSTT